MGKKGRRRADSDDDPLADNLKHLALKAEQEKAENGGADDNSGANHMSRAEKEEGKEE